MELTREVSTYFTTFGT